MQLTIAIKQASSSQTKGDSVDQAGDVLDHSYRSEAIDLIKQAKQILRTQNKQFQGQADEYLSMAIDQLKNGSDDDGKESSPEKGSDGISQ